MPFPSTRVSIFVTYSARWHGCMVHDGYIIQAADSQGIELHIYYRLREVPSDGGEYAYVVWIDRWPRYLASQCPWRLIRGNEDQGAGRGGIETNCAPTTPICESEYQKVLYTGSRRQGVNTPRIPNTLLSQRMQRV